MKYKYVYVRGRLDSEENGWNTFENVDAKTAVKKFKSWLQKENDSDRDVYIEVVVASDNKFVTIDGSNF